MKTMNARHTYRGLSLIELMVALTIGSLLIIGAVSVYVQSRTTYRINETVARMQENARYAMSLMEPDIRLANHWGLMSDPLLITGTVGNLPPSRYRPAAQACGATFPIDFRLPVDGENGAYALGCPVAPAAGGALAGTDTLIIRRASTDAVAADADRMQVYTTRQGTVQPRIYRRRRAGADSCRSALWTECRGARSHSACVLHRTAVEHRRGNSSTASQDSRGRRECLDRTSTMKRSCRASRTCKCSSAST